MKPKSALRSFPLLAGSSLLAVSSLQAQTTYTWVPTVAGTTYNWNNSVEGNDNWGTDPAGGFPNAVGDTANLNIDIAGAQTIRLNVPITVGTLNIGDTTTSFFARTISPNGGSLIFDNTGSTNAVLKRDNGSGTTAQDTISAGITLNDNLEITNTNGNRDNNLALTGKITGSGGIILVAGASIGHVYLSNTTNDYAGGLTLNASTRLQTGSNSAAFGTGTITINGGIVDTSFSGAAGQSITTTNTTIMNGNWSIPSVIGGGTWNNNGPVTLGNHVSVDRGVAANFGGNLTETGGARSLTLTGGGSSTFSGSNSYTGGTNVSAGTAKFAKIVAMPATGTVAMATNTTLAVNAGGTGEFTNATSGAGSIGGLLDATSPIGGQGAPVTYAGTARLGIDTTNAGGSFTYSGVIPNKGTTLGITKQGSGTLVLDQENTYTGTTMVNAGVLKLDNAGALGTGNLMLSGGVVGLTTASGNFSRPNGTAAGQVQITASGGFAAYGVDRSATMGTGTRQWNTGSFVPNGSSLILGAADADATITFTNALNLANGSRTIQVPNGSAAVDAIVSGSIGVSGGQAGNLTKSGTGTLALTNNSALSYTGTTTVSAGTLQLGNGGTTGGLGAIASPISVSSGATLAVNRSNDFSQATAINGQAINGAGNFAQNGAGTTTLSVANGYTGATTINAGTLVITGATQATSAITFGGAGVLGLDIATPVTAANATVDLTGGSVLVTGTTGAPSYTLLTASSITPLNPTLAVAVPGYILQVIGGNELRLIQSGSPTGYAAWQAANSTSGTSDQDHDNDGVDNGTEHFLGGDTNTTGFTALPTVVNNAGTLSVTWTKDADYTGAYTTDFVVETATTLAGPWTPETVGGNVIITGNNVTYTFPGGPAYTGKNFARLKVTGP